MRKLILFFTCLMFGLSAQAAITSAAPPNGTQGTAYLFQMTTNTPSPGFFYFWEVTGLPPGVNLNQQGVNNASLNGTPTTSGTYNVSVTTRDTNAAGAILDGPVLYTIVIAAPAAPSISGVPTLSEAGALMLVLLVAGTVAYSRRRID